ncbi:MAG: NAD(P)/FAD-dependent oxidoreductase [Limnochordaceae bacterium]|nr:NAD(P)/FAD-dependent oxidoreductase [Limnochordaceae bacterium]
MKWLTEQLVDITFVGAGPVALYGVFCAGIHHLSCRVLESMQEVGGQLATLYPEKEIYDVAGYPKVTGRELVAALKEQAAHFPAQFVLGRTATTLSQAEDDTFIIRDQNGEAYPTRAVLITAGIGAFQPRTLPLPELERLTGRGVSFLVSDPERFRDRSVLIVGGGDSAVDWALELVPVARRVILIHRRGQFRAFPGSAEQLQRSPVDVRLYHELVQVLGDGVVQGAVVVDNRTHERTQLDVDDIILALGFAPNLGPLRDWGLEFSGDAIVVNTRMETNRPGIFAAGDIATYPGKVKLMATGFGEVATAVNAARLYIYPESRAPGHSSALKLG